MTTKPYILTVMRDLTEVISKLANLIDAESRQGDPFLVGESLVRPMRELMEVRRRIEEGEL